MDKIEDRTIFISGADLIHGTPVIDIKPYHYLDSLDKDSIFPDWLLESKERGRLKVNYIQSSKEELQTIIDQKRLDFYTDFDEVS